MQSVDEFAEEFVRQTSLPGKYLKFEPVVRFGCLVGIRVVFPSTLTIAFDGEEYYLCSLADAHFELNEDDECPISLEKVKKITADFVKAVKYDELILRHQKPH